MGGTPAQRWLLGAACLVIGLIAGYVIATSARGEKTLTETTTVSIQRSTHLPVACLQALALIRATKGLVSRARLAQMQADFRAVVPSCKIPDACKEAFNTGAKLLFETQQTRAEALAIVREFQAAAAGCR